MKYKIVMFLLATSVAANAAVKGPILPGDKGKHAIADSDSIPKKRSVSVGINYGSDVLFFGRTGPIRYPYMNTDVIYNTKNGFFIYGSAVKVLGYDPLVDEYDL